MGDAYRLKVVLKEKIDFNRLIDFLRKEKHNLIVKEDEEDKTLILEVDYETKEEFLVVYNQKIISFMHLWGPQKDNSKLKKIFEKIYGFVKKEYPIKDVSEWFGYQIPYQWVLPYKTKKEQWEINE